MAVLVLTFVSILLATFALVAVVTRQSADEKVVGERMAWIHLSQKAKAGAGPDSGQLLKETRGSRFGWLDEFLSRFHFAQSLQVRILQANSSTSVCWPHPDQSGFVDRRVCDHVALCTDDSDRPGGRGSAQFVAVRDSFPEAYEKSQCVQHSSAGVH